MNKLEQLQHVGVRRERLTYFHKGPVLQGLGVQKDAAEVAREEEVVLRADLALARHYSLENAGAVVDTIIAFHRLRGCTMLILAPTEKPLRLDLSHNFIDLSFRKLIHQFKMAPQEPPSLADFADNQEDCLRNLCLDLT